jgi:hypothetical protein
MPGQERTTPFGWCGEFGVAQRLGVSVGAVVSMLKDGKLPPHKRRGSTGRKIWRISDIEAFAEEFKQASSV